MVARVAALCALEAVVGVWLAANVFGGAEPAAPSSPASEIAAAASGAPVAASVAPADTRQAAAATTSPAAAPRAAAAAKWRPDDPVGVLLTGRVAAADGAPVAVQLSAQREGAAVHATSGADGSYALVGLQPGEWSVTLGGTGFVKSTTAVEIADDAVQQRDFTVARSVAVRVRIVTADGADATRAVRTSLRGFPDFAVAGQRERFPERFAPTDYGIVFVGDATWDNEMNPKDGFAGTLHLASVPAHVALLQRHMVLQQEVVQPGQQEVKFTVDVAALKALAGSATVRVFDAAGVPLAGARVSLGSSNRADGGTLVDAEGRATLEGLSPGLLRCQITAKDHETMYTTVRVDPGQRLELGDVRLGPKLDLRGTVLNADGKPATAQISWTELKWRTRATAAFETNRVARVEADGTFSLWGTGQGAIAVTARDRQGNVAMGVFENPPREPVVLRLEKGCACVVTRPADPSRTFTMTLFDGSRRAIAATTLASRSAKATVHMPEGEYSYEVHDDHEQLLQSGTVTFGAEPCAVEIR
jgi:hypothetical protein